MTKTKRSVTISTELDEALAMLSTANSMNYSEFLESRLRMVPAIQQMILKLEKLPEAPIVDISKLKQPQKEQQIAI